MALAKKRSNATRLIVITAVVIAVLGIGYVLFKQFFLNSSNSANSANSAARNVKVITDFGESILNDSRYTSLKSFETAVNADANVDGGQSNPFR